MYNRKKVRGLQYIGRYEKINTVTSQLNPFEDVANWIEGLTSSNHVKNILKENHQLKGPMTVQERAKDIARFVDMACKYLEQASNSPKEVSFLPAYYAILNLLKAYITIGPYGDKLDKNRRHGASYNPDINMKKFPNDFITLHSKGTIALFYQTITGDNMFQNKKETLDVKMGDVYPYIYALSAEYVMATSKQPKIIPFEIITVDNNKGWQRIEARCLDEDFNKVKISTLQGFTSLFEEQAGSNRLISRWYDINDIASMKECIRLELLYGSMRFYEEEIQWVPLSSQLLMPQEMPLLCAFFHMSSVVRYQPKILEELMDSKYWPMLLTLRNHGLYSFLVLFWSYVTQCRTYIVTM